MPANGEMPLPSLRPPEKLVSWAFVPGSFVLVSELVFERLYFQGPQMWLFSFAHMHPLLMMWGVLSFWGSLIWVGAVILKAAITQPRWALLVGLRVPIGVSAVLLAMGFLLG